MHMFVYIYKAKNKLVLNCLLTSLLIVVISSNLSYFLKISLVKSSKNVNLGQVNFMIEQVKLDADPPEEYPITKKLILSP